MKLIEQILDRVAYDVITDTELTALVAKSAPSRYNQIKRALAKGDLIQLRRGLYHLSKRYQRQGVNPYVLSQRIYGPSYVSFETALSYHGLIPEAVYSTTSASSKRSREFQTPLGVFYYTQIPIRVFFEGVERIEKKDQIFLMATPLKALTDYVYAHRLDWEGTAPLTDSLRIERDDLKLNTQEIDELKFAYRTERTTRFLEGLKKDLKL